MHASVLVLVNFGGVEGPDFALSVFDMLTEGSVLARRNIRFAMPPLLLMVLTGIDGSASEKSNRLDKSLVDFSGDNAGGVTCLDEDGATGM